MKKHPATIPTHRKRWMKQNNHTHAKANKLSKFSQFTNPLNQELSGFCSGSSWITPHGHLALNHSIKTTAASHLPSLRKTNGRLLVWILFVLRENTTLRIIPTTEIIESTANYPMRQSSINRVATVA